MYYDHDIHSITFSQGHNTLAVKGNYSELITLTFFSFFSFFLMVIGLEKHLKDESSKTVR